MPTGACGLACDVCKLKLLNICTSCGPGKSQLAKAKLEAQKRLVGGPLPYPGLRQSEAGGLLSAGLRPLSL